MPVRHFLTLLDLSADELDGLMERAREMKRLLRNRVPHAVMTGRVLGMIFEKSSTRTRVSFESGMIQMGGGALFLSPRDTQLGRGEPVEDSARVLSRMVDLITIRTFAHENLQRFSEYSRVPVVNALTDRYHPCQLLADMQTYLEQRSAIAGATVAWIGDGNNMCHSYINAARQWNFRLRIACPKGYEPDPGIVAAAGERVELGHDPEHACRDADLVVTDVWASMGQEQEQEQRAALFQPFQVNRQLMALADRDALFMHCLPAHRGEEVTEEVLEGPQSIVWDEAENRLHAQKALLEFLSMQASS